jgi:hypothetical protein
MPLWSRAFVPKNRRTYKIWAEGKVPDVVIETTSRKTRRKDTRVKPGLYARLGVKEYFLFDPLGEYLDPPLQGYRLEGENYRRIEPSADGDLDSRELELHLRVGVGHLDFVRWDSGERLLTRAERAECEAKARRRETERAGREAEARRRETERAEREAEARRRETERASNAKPKPGGLPRPKWLGCRPSWLGVTHRRSRSDDCRWVFCQTEWWSSGR